MKSLFLLLVLVTNLLPGQKIVKKSLINPEIEAISIDATYNYELYIDTVSGDEMTLEAVSDGEYKNSLFLNVRESGNTLLVSTDFTPDHSLPQDKLSAHKVISVALKITLPMGERIRVFGTGCNVSAKGSYDSLKITLNDGRCLLENISGSVEVATQSGDISIKAKEARIKARSKYGKVSENSVPIGDNLYELSSISGNIAINKIR